MLFQCSQEQLDNIIAFAIKVNKARYSRDSNNKDQGRHRIIREIVGKVGEESAVAYCGGQVNYDIFKTGTYNHSADIGPNVYVKTCSSEEAKKYGTSWLFDRYDPLVVEPQSDQKIILVCANQDGKAYVLGHVCATDLAGLFGPSRKLPHKVAIWLNDNGEFKGVKSFIRRN